MVFEGLGNNSTLRKFAPETRGQLFFYLLLGGMLLLYFASGAISKQIKQPVSIGPFMFFVVMGVALWILVFAASKMVRPAGVTGEQWVMMGLAAVAIIAIFYFFPGIIPAGFQGAFTDINPYIGSIVGGP